MERIGQAVGIGLALTFSAAAAAAGLFPQAGQDEWLRAGWTALGFAAACAPLGWLLGRRYDKLKNWAEKDSLTGAVTRRFIRTFYSRLVVKADRRNKRFSVLLVDVNDFKTINDSFGHSKGDELLRKLAAGLSDCCRQGEIAGRWGGDEFLLLCPYGDRSSLDALNRAVNERLAGITGPWNRPLSVSVGFAVYPEDGRVLEELVQEADRRMYADKNKRKETAPQQRLNA